MSRVEEKFEAGELPCPSFRQRKIVNMNIEMKRKIGIGKVYVDVKEAMEKDMIFRTRRDGCKDYPSPNRVKDLTCCCSQTYRV